VGKSKIEWCDYTWNPITGCTPISEGCRNCYAARMAKRLAGRFGYPKDEPFTPGVVHPDKLGDIGKLRKPRRIFVCSMGDLFHDDVPLSSVARIFEYVWTNKQHTFMFLTKRPERMREFFTQKNSKACYGGVWPQPHVWLGVTAENQEQANKRIPILLETPASLRFVSIEPMIGPVDLDERELLIDKRRFKYTFGNYLDWVIVGGETGPGARPMNLEWVSSIQGQCSNVGVPLFFKSWGKFKPHFDFVSHQKQFPEKRSKP